MAILSARGVAVTLLAFSFLPLAGQAQDVDSGAAPAHEGTLVVLDKSDAMATFVDAASGTVLARCPTGIGPHEADVTPDGRAVVVCDYGAAEPGHTLTVIDVESARVKRTIDLGAAARPHGVVCLSDGRRALVTAEARRALLEIDLEEGRVLRELPTAAEASHMLALSRDERRAFVANIGSGSVTVIDLESGAILRQVETGAGAEGIALRPDGAEVWVTNRAADTVVSIDTSTLEVSDSLPCASFPIRVQFTPDGQRALVSCAQSGDVALFDATDHVERSRISFKARAPAAAGDQGARVFADRFGPSPVPVGIRIAPDGLHAWVACTNADLVAVVDLRRGEVIGDLRSGREPDGMAWSARATRAAPTPSEEGR